MREPIKKYTHKEWMEEGKHRFGTDVTKWRFKCVQCGHIQTYSNFVEKGIDPVQAKRLIAYSCIGRKVPNLGCDWTLGGLFKIHTVEVDGHPTFDFADHNDESMPTNADV